MRVPIKYRDRVMGVITLAMGRSGRRYSLDDLNLAEELGRRSGVAIENGRLYRELQESDKRKDEFIATLAHELRNPLAPLLIRAQHLQDYAQKENVTDSMVKETSFVVERQVQTMARLLDDLLDISRLMRGKISLKKEYIDISTIVRRAIETTRPHFNQNNVDLMFDDIRGPLIIYADPIRIEQSIVNLLNNASKFSNPKGKVEIDMEKIEDRVLIRIKDEGVGIHADTLPKIFDIFIQAERPKGQVQGGLGIGLALARNFIQMHGGDLKASSEGLGMGATFTISLPLSAKNIKDSEKKDVSILIVDDNIDAANAISDFLKYSGYMNVKVAYDGEQGIKIGQTIQPKFVLLDIRMPGMDGYDTVEAMRKDSSFDEAKIIAVTGYGQDEDKQKAEEAGFDHHFTKPIDTKSLLKILRS
jgi:signal transduction histidine kinase